MMHIALLIFFTNIFATCHGQWTANRQQRVNLLPQSYSYQPQYEQPLPRSENQSPRRLPFPDCVYTDAAKYLLNPGTVHTMFRNNVIAENQRMRQQTSRVDGVFQNGIIDFNPRPIRTEPFHRSVISRVLSQTSQDLLEQLGCITNSSITTQLQDFLETIEIPERYCGIKPEPDCSEEDILKYRTLTGICNNMEKPKQGSVHTAYARLLPSAYENGINTPRTLSVLGGDLPNCRQISLNLGSKPVQDANFNNLFVTYGQFFVHDITLGIPFTADNAAPTVNCTCNSTDFQQCNIIPLAPNDPVFAGQRCIASPATPQAINEEQCTLSTKEQLNGNTHYVDLSMVYGSTHDRSEEIRSFEDGLLSSTRPLWSKYEIPPSVTTERFCTDSTEANRCFNGGDMRLMENLVLSGLQTQWLRFHNLIARELPSVRPDWRNDDNRLFFETRKITSALHQVYTFEEWLPILIGEQAVQQFVAGKTGVTQYDPATPGVVFNEVAVAALRLHTLVRDLYSRCRPNGEFIDQIAFNAINSKSRLAYDGVNNGVDAFICGALQDFGHAVDTNFGHEVLHRLFEQMSPRGEVIRHDIVARNICRGREHGTQSYNAYRQLCGLRPAMQFQDFADTMSTESIQKLQSIYQHPEDVELFVGLNSEDHVEGGLVGPVSACLIGLQLKHLKFGDRFFFRHQGQFTPEQMNSLTYYPYSCFVCHTTDIHQVPRDAFRPPDDQANPFVRCSDCAPFDLRPWGNVTQ